MNCSCRTAALKVFVRSIAHIHVPSAAAAARALPRAQPFPGCLPVVPNLTGAAGSLPLVASRGIHTTTTRNGELETALAGGRHVEPKHGNTPSNSSAWKDSAGGEVASRSKRPADKNPSPRSSGARRTKPQYRPSRAPQAGGRDSQTGGRRPDNKREVAPKETGGLEYKGLEALSKPPPDWREAQAGRRKQRRAPFKYKEDAFLRAEEVIKESKEEKEDDDEPPTKTNWRAQKEALKKKFPEGWNPRKKLSPDALAGIRALHAQFPEVYSTEVLAKNFEMSPEAIRRILRSKWTPSSEEEIDRQERWFNRGKKVWARWAELGKKPPRKWRAEGIVRDPIWNEKGWPKPKKVHPVEAEEEPTTEEKKRMRAQQKLSENM
ncbi:required for respiratory growth protein 9, mitochondrial, partial [Podospora didyma]